METYVPWMWSAFFAAAMVLSRLATNRILRGTLGPVPGLVSSVYILGFVGLVAMFFWSIFAIAWWACVPVIGIYGLTCLVPSAVQEAMRDPKIVHLAAIQQAASELSSKPPGDEKMEAVMERADQIMRSWRWIPKS